MRKEVIAITNVLLNNLGTVVLHSLNEELLMSDFKESSLNTGKYIIKDLVHYTDGSDSIVGDNSRFVIVI